MEIPITIDDLKQMKGRNGLAFLDCDMHPLELLDEVNRAFRHGGILLDNSELKDVLSFRHDGKVDLLLPFNDAKLHSTKIVIWQMATYESCRGIFFSDYIRDTLRGIARETDRQAGQSVGAKTSDQALSQKGPDQKKILAGRLEQSYTAYMEGLQGKTASELIAMAPEITAVQQLHKELLGACDKDAVAFLLQFDDPLEAVRDDWESEINGYSHRREIGHMLCDIRERTLYYRERLTQPLKGADKMPRSAVPGKKSKKKERHPHER